jgi:hypothetical protein
MLSSKEAKYVYSIQKGYYQLLMLASNYYLTTKQACLIVFK